MLFVDINVIVSVIIFEPLRDAAVTDTQYTKLRT